MMPQFDFSLKKHTNFFFPFWYLPSSQVPDKEIDAICSTVRAVTMKRRAELVLISLA